MPFRIMCKLVDVARHERGSALVYAHVHFDIPHLQQSCTGRALHVLDASPAPTHAVSFPLFSLHMEKQAE